MTPTAKAVACATTLLLLVGCAPKREGLVVASNAVLADDARFVTSDTAAQAYADVAATLLESTKRCVVARTARDPRCAARASAAAFAQVLSVQVVGCDRDGRARSRIAAKAALRTVDDADRARGKKPAPSPPAMPRC